MHDDEIRINPIIYYGPGSCSECLTPLVLIDTESNIFQLDDRGSVVDILDTKIVCNAICPRCRKKFKMMRSNGVYKPFSESRMYFDKIELEERIEQRLKGRYDGDPAYNPLAIDN